MAKSKSKISAGGLQKSAISATARGAGAIAGAYAVNGLLPSMTTNASIIKFAGPICIGLGILAEAFAPDGMAKDAAQGIGTYGMLKTANAFMPESLKEKVKLGLTGTMSGVDDLEGIGRVEPDWQRIVRDSEREAAINGPYDLDEERMSGPDAFSYDRAEQMAGAEDGYIRREFDYSYGMGGADDGTSWD
jgi:hypothetical protein